ncbi:MAG: VOC family protein [Xanthobacteraceae bacterium]
MRPAIELLINIDVPDLEAAERFYTTAFGLRAARRFGVDAIELAGWPVPVYLLSKPSGEVGAGNDLRRYGRHWTPIHPDVVVHHLEEAVQKALAAGASLEDPARETPYGRIAMMADPFGHGFCMIQFNTQGYDALAAPSPSDEIAPRADSEAVHPAR